MSDKKSTYTATFEANKKVRIQTIVQATSCEEAKELAIEQIADGLNFVCEDAISYFLTTVCNSVIRKVDTE